MQVLKSNDYNEFLGNIMNDDNIVNDVVDDMNGGTDNTTNNVPVQNNDRYVSSNTVDVKLPLEDRLFSLLTTDEIDSENNLLKQCDPNKGIYKECYYYDDCCYCYRDLGIDYMTFMQNGSQQCSQNDVQHGLFFSKSVGDCINEKFDSLQRTRKNRRELGLYYEDFKKAITNNDTKIQFIRYIDRTLSLLPTESVSKFIDILCSVASFMRYYNLAVDTRVYMNVVRYFGKGYPLPKIIYMIVNGHNMLGIKDDMIFKYKSKFNNSAKLDKLIKQKAVYDATRNKDVFPINLTFDFIMIVAKYLDSESDHVHLAKVCREYNNYIELFKYNPIPDPHDLFNEKQTLCIYSSYNYVNEHFNGLVKVMCDVDYSTRCRYVKLFGKENVHLIKDVYTCRMPYRLYQSTYNGQWTKDDFINDKDSNGFYIMQNDLVVQEDVTVICKDCFRDYKEQLNVTLPTVLNVISKSAFKNSYITSVNIPSTVTRIDNGAFRGCIYLSKVTFDTTSITTLSKNCFSACYSITNVIIPEGVEEIGRDCFRSCTSLNVIKLPSTLKAIKECAFKNTRIYDVDIPDGVTELGEECFCIITPRKGGINKINLPRSLEKIGERVFELSLVNKLVIPPNFSMVNMKSFGKVTIKTLCIRKDKIINIDGVCTFLKSTKVIRGDAHIGFYDFYDYDIYKNLPSDLFKDFKITEEEHN